MSNPIYKLLLKKLYDGESISDIEEDVYTAIVGANLPKDKDGFEQGEFSIKLEWKQDNGY